MHIGVRRDVVTFQQACAVRRALGRRVGLQGAAGRQLQQQALARSRLLCRRCAGKFVEGDSQLRAVCIRLVVQYAGVHGLQVLAQAIEAEQQDVAKQAVKAQLPATQRRQDILHGLWKG